MELLEAAYQKRVYKRESVSNFLSMRMKVHTIVYILSLLRHDFRKSTKKRNTNTIITVLFVVFSLLDIAVSKKDQRYLIT